MKTQKVSFHFKNFQFHFELSHKVAFNSIFNSDLVHFGIALEKWQSEVDDIKEFSTFETIRIYTQSYFDGMGYEVKFLGVD